MVFVEALGREHALAWTCTMSKKEEIISGDAAAAAAPLYILNKIHSSREKQSFVNQNELKEKNPQKRANYTINSNLSARPPLRRSGAVSRERLRAA